MLKVCISHDTGGRRGGHLTEYAFTGLPEVEISALSDVNPEAEKTFRLTGAKRLYTSFTDMVEAERPDIVVLCSRLPGEHYEQIKFALGHRCHVLCEKPLAETLTQADELAGLSRQSGHLVQMAHPARFAPAFHELKRMIAAGAIGKVLTCYMRGKEDHRGGGEDMLVLGTHLLDAAVWLFGMPEQVFADIRWQGRHLTSLDIAPTAEPVGPCGGDEVFALYRFPNGINGVFESRRGMVPKGEERLGIVVSGTLGTLAIRYSGNRELRICRDFPTPVEDRAVFETVPLPPAPPIPGAKEIDLTAWGCDSSRYLFHYFAENNRRAAWNLLRAIRGEEKLVAGIDSALGSLEMITGAYQSALAHAPVSFPLANRNHPLSAHERN